MKSFCSLKSLGLIWQKTYLISPSKREFSNQLLSNFRLYQRPLKGPAYKLTLCICTCQPSKLHDVIPYDKSLCIHLFNYPFVQPYPPPTHTYTHILLIIFVWRSLTESNSRASHPLGWSLIWCMIVKRVTSISFARKQNLVKRVIFFFFIILIHSVTGHPRVHSRYEGENYTRVLLPDHWGLGLYLKVCLSGPFYP